MRYLMVRDSDGLCVNAIEWDGVTDYTPPANTRLIAWDDTPRAWIGWRRVGDEWVAPPEPEPEPEAST
jgi:hypothetical protein